MYFLYDPLGCCLGIDLLLLLVEDSDNFLLGICQILIPLVGGVEIDLAHLMGFQRYFDVVDDFYELVHAEKILRNLTLVERHQQQILDVLDLVLAGLVGLVLEHRHQLAQLLSCQSFHPSRPVMNKINQTMPQRL